MAKNTLHWEQINSLSEFSPDTRVAIYNRVSTLRLEQIEAIEHQVIESRDIVEKAGLKIVHQFIENKSALSIDKREQYKNLLCAMKNGEIDLIVIKSQDRLMRDASEWNMFIRDITKYNVMVYFYLENKLFNRFQDEFIYNIKASMHAEDSKLKSMKIRDAYQRKLNYTGQDCLHITKAVYGFDRNVRLDDRGHKVITFTINEKEADNIREVCRLIENGLGFYRISNEMFSRGVLSKPTYGTQASEPIRISGTQWKKLINNPMIHGDVYLHKETVDFYTKKRIKLPPDEWVLKENIVPAIITKEYHEKILNILKDRTYKTNRDTSRIGRHFWSNKMVCGLCGKTFYRLPCNTSGGRVLENWKCSTQMNSGRHMCDNLVINGDTLDKYLKNEFMVRYNDLFVSLSDGLIAKTLRIIENCLMNGNDSDDMKDLENKLTLLNNKKDVLFNKLMDGIIGDNDFKIYNDRLENEMSDINEKLMEVKNRKDTLTDKRQRLLDIKNGIKCRHYEKEAVACELKNCLDDVVVNGTGEIIVHMNKMKMHDKFPVSEFIYGDNDYVFNMQYKKETIHETRRNETNEKIIQLLKNDTSHELTLPKIADALNVKYSYVYTSFQMLKDMGKIKLVKDGFGHDMQYWIVL